MVVVVEEPVEKAGRGGVKLLTPPMPLKLPTFCCGWHVADARCSRACQVDFHDDGVDQHLGQDDVQLGDDVLDHLHVLVIGEDEQGIGAFVGDDLGLAEELELAGAGGVLHDAVEVVVGRNCARWWRPNSWALVLPGGLSGIAAVPPQLADAAGAANARRPVAGAPPLAETGAGTALADGGAAAGPERAQSRGDVAGQGVFDGDDLRLDDEGRQVTSIFLTISIMRSTFSA